MGLNDLKTVISKSVTKNILDALRCGRGQIAERWKKIVENDEKYFN